MPGQVYESMIVGKGIETNNSEQIDSGYHKYQFMYSDKLGSGSFGQVYKGRRLSDNLEVAIKCIDKSCIRKHGQAMQTAISNEIDILIQMSENKKFTNEHVIKIYDCYDNPQNIYIILELCDGGSLQDKLKVKGRFAEAEAKEILRQVLTALKIMHEQNIAHRDLKPENVFISRNVYKLGDFGFAKQKYVFNTQLGTLPYQAPEYYTSANQSNKVDIWSTGVMFHELLFNQLYFVEGQETSFGVQKNIIEKQYILQNDQKSMISKECHDILCKMLVKDPEQRPSANELLNHPFFGANKSCDARSQIEKHINAIDFLLNTVTEIAQQFNHSTLGIFMLVYKANQMISRQKQELEQKSNRSESYMVLYSSNHYNQVLQEVMTRYNTISQLLNQLMQAQNQKLANMQDQSYQMVFDYMINDRTTNCWIEFYRAQLLQDADEYFKMAHSQLKYAQLCYRLLICCEIDQIVNNNNYEFNNIKQFLNSNNYVKFLSLYNEKSVQMF